MTGWKRDVALAFVFLHFLALFAYTLRWLWIAILAVALLINAISSARAHSWYDAECCSNQDCKPVVTEDVVEIEDGGWKYLPTGTVFRRDQVKPSRDRHFHVCIGVAEWNRGKPYCIYVLQGT